MSLHALHIPELDELIMHGSPERQVKTLKRVTAFFLDGASRLDESHVQVFDLVFSRLIDHVASKPRTELSCRLAPLGNAPVEAVRRLAQDDSIAVAGPVLKQAERLSESDLIDIAENKSQAHLLAISARVRLDEPVTDVLLRRGDRVHVGPPALELEPSCRICRLRCAVGFRVRQPDRARALLVRVHGIRHRALHLWALDRPPRKPSARGPHRCGHRGLHRGQHVQLWTGEVVEQSVELVLDLLREVLNPLEHLVEERGDLPRRWLRGRIGDPLGDPCKRSSRGLVLVRVRNWRHRLPPFRRIGRASPVRGAVSRKRLACPAPPEDNGYGGDPQ